MKNNINSIKERLENSDTFQYNKDEVGISWDDFEIIDLATNTVLKQGSKKIGSYNIMINGDKMSACYDLTVDGLAEKRLAKLER